MPSSSETDPLLARHNRARRTSRYRETVQAAAFSVLAFIVIWLVTFRGFRASWSSDNDVRDLPNDPLERARALLRLQPVIDGHIDLPIQARLHYSNDVNKIDLNEPIKHVSIPLLRQGGVGGFFWSAFVPCPNEVSAGDGKNHTTATWRVRDTLEQIDVAKLLMDKYPDIFEFALTSGGVRAAIANKRIAGLIGIEGGHQLGNSIAVMRQYYALGARYITLTHTCNNVFAGSCGFQGKPIKKMGLTDFGKKLVHEMNRIGMIVDLSHTSHDTAAEVLKHSKAPVIFSHSNAQAVWDVPRNVPDYILKEVKRTGSLVMATFAPQFVSQSEAGVGHQATLERVADHIEYIAGLTGREHVGLGSDFDGIGSTPVGLENVSRYPYLVAELIRRGWSDQDVMGLAGGNFIRTFEAIEEVSSKLKDERPEMALYDKRPDLPWHFGL